MKIWSYLLLTVMVACLSVARADEASDDEAIHKEAYDAMVQSVLPLEPNEIKALRRTFNSIQKASAYEEAVPSQPTSRSLIVNLQPGEAPPIVRLGSGYVTSLVFLDATGSPWPIKAYDIGNPKAFNVQGINGDDSKSNTLMIQAISMYKQGNLAVMLEGLNIPVMITLIPGQKALDYRVDMQIPGYGPNAAPQIESLPGKANTALIDIINNIPPKGAKELQVTGGDARAWYVNKVMYLRTSDILVSPSWVSTMTGLEGVIHAYQLQLTNELLVIHDGKLVELHLEGL